VSDLGRQVGLAHGKSDEWTNLSLAKEGRVRI
jgi:hypothetical protein